MHMTTVVCSAFIKLVAAASVSGFPVHHFDEFASKAYCSGKTGGGGDVTRFTPGVHHKE